MKNYFAIFFSLTHNATPLFVLPNFLPDASINRTVYTSFNDNRGLSSVSLRLQSALAHTKFSYALHGMLLHIGSYNKPFGILQRLNTLQAQIVTSAAWRPSANTTFTFANTLQRQTQRVGGVGSDAAISNTAEVAITLAKLSRCSFEMAGGYFFNRAGSTAGGMPIWRASGVISFGKWSMFVQAYNLLDKQQFETVYVGNGTSIVNKTSLLPRYLLVGLRYKF
jgi:hypothetical protein